MFKKLDNYIIKKIVTTFFFAIVSVLCISVVFDISEKLNDFLKLKADIPQEIFNYYTGFVVYIGNMFFPLFTLITIVMVTLKMNQKSEIVAILSTGISFNRMLRPFFIGTGFIVLFSFFVNFFLLPQANQKRLDFEKVHTGYSSVLSGMHFEIEPGTIISFKRYNFKEMKMVSDLWIDRYEKDKNGRNVLKYTLKSDYAYGDSSTNHFSLKNTLERYIFENGDSIIKSRSLDTIFNFGLKDFGQRNDVISTMYFGELLAFRKKETDKGSAIVPYIEIEIYSRVSNPLSLFILALLGVCISISPARSNVGSTILLGIGSVALYFVFNRFTTVYATNAGLNPLLAVWIPNLILLAFAVYLYFKTPK